MNFKIIFNLDGTGIYYQPTEPTHIDSLLAYCLAPMQVGDMDLQKDDKPADIKLPLLRTNIKGFNIWNASAILPDGYFNETTRFWRKKLRKDRLHLTTGNPNTKQHIYRDYNVPFSLLLVNKMIAYASGNRKEVKKLFKKHIKSLGKKKAYGYGKIVSIETEETEKNFSFIKDGEAMRFLPSESGYRLSRIAPPYWNSIDRIKCCEIGDKYQL